MFSHVYIQAGFLSKSALALLTLVRLLPAVYPEVCFQVVLVGEILAADGAVVRSLATVAPDMHGHDILVGESLGAVRALQDLVALDMAWESIEGQCLPANVAQHFVLMRGVV